LYTSVLGEIGWGFRKETEGVEPAAEEIGDESQVMGVPRESAMSIHY